MALARLQPTQGVGDRAATRPATTVAAIEIAEMETIQFAILPVKYMPKEAEGLKLGLGCWTQNGSTITSLNMIGFYPYVDRKLNYAAILVPKKTDELKKEMYIQFKQKMDAAFGK